MEEKVRLSDIAEELGLSTAAVSYVLHGKTGMVSERTALGAIAKMRAGEPAEPVITLSTSLVIRDSTRNC